MRRFSVYILLFLVSFGLVSCETNESFLVTGTVVDQISMQTIEGAELEAIGFFNSDHGPMEGRVLATATSGHNGKFYLGFEADTKVNYFVRVKKSGYSASADVAIDETYEEDLVVRMNLILQE